MASVTLLFAPSEYHFQVYRHMRRSYRINYRYLLNPIALFFVLCAVSLNSQAANLVAKYHLEETLWSGTVGELTDSAGYAGGPFNGEGIGSPVPLTASTTPARSGDPGTCGYAQLRGPSSNGSAFSIPNLPVSTANGAQTSISFWMNWDGTNSVMPMGWNRHDLWLVSGHFGFNTGNGDVYGTSSTGLANGWHHVVAVFNNGNITANEIYIDGVAQTLTQRRSTPRNNYAVVSTTLRVGGWQVNNSYRFSGGIDEIRVLNGAVTAGEVTTLYTETHPCPTPPKTPIAEWRLDESDGTTAFDEGGSSYDGATEGNVVMGTAGILCTAYSFTGGYVSLPSGFPNLTSGITITGWFRPSNVTTSGQRLFADDENNTGGYAVSLGDSGAGKIRFFSRGPNPLSLDSAAVISANNWYFVAAVADTTARTKKLYIYDAAGNLIDSSSQNWSGSWGTDAGISSMGGETIASSESSFRFQGEIDEVQIFDKPLDATEIDDGYNHQQAGRNWNGSTRSCPVLIAEFQMETGSWAGLAGELKDSAGYSSGPFNGQAIGSSLPLKSSVSPARTGVTGTCDYASLPGPSSNGGAFTIPNLPVSLTNGDKTSVAFWMYWDGSNSVMPIGWVYHDLWFVNGSFGFNTGNSDVFGISSAGLANGWHHVVAVFTNGNVTGNKLYIDGVDQTLSQQRSTPNTSRASVSTTLRIGGWQASNSYRFSGQIDEVKVYRGEVTQPIVTSLYNETHACTVQTPQLEALWRSDEPEWDGTSAEVADGSGNGHAGTSVNGATTSSVSSARLGDPGTCGYGAYDGSNDYVVIPHSNLINPDSFSVSLWARVDGGSGSWRSPITSRGYSGSDRYGYNLYAGTNNRWQFWTGRGGTAGNGWDVLSGPAVTGSWTHIVTTFQKSQDVGSGTWRGIKRLYINGALEATNSNAYYRPMNSGYVANLTIGAGGQNGSSHHFNGAVDEVRVYSSVLDSSTITALYNETHPCPAGNDAFGFNCIESGADAITGRLFTKKVGQSFAFDVSALKDSDSDGSADSIETDYAADADRTVTVELIDTSTSATCSAYSAVNPAVSQNLVFTSAEGGRKSAASMSVSRAYRSLGCRVTDSGGISPVIGCSTDMFAVRPSSLTMGIPTLTNSGSSGVPTGTAGASFTLTADADNGYDGTPTLDSAKLEAHVGAIQTGTLSGTFTAANPATGTASGNNFSFSEVGNFRLLSEGVYDDTYTSVDQSSDCTNDFSNTVVGGRVGCKFGNSSATSWVGRFIPADFLTTIDSDGALQNSCTSGGFSYLGEAIGFNASNKPKATITARNSSGSTTQNYSGSYSKLSLSDINIPSISTDATQLGVDGSNKIGLSWTLGGPSLTDNADGTFTFALTGDTFTYARTANDLVAPFTNDIDLVIQSIVDGDAVTGSGLPKQFSPNGVPVRFGRIELINAQGSELQPLNIEMQAQYYNGAANGFVLNTNDSCTQVTSLALQDLDSSDGLIATTSAGRNTAIYAPASLASGYAASDLSDVGLLFQQPPIVPGIFNLNLQPPGQGNTGSAQVDVIVPSWLKYWWEGTLADDNPSAKATFGIYSHPTSIIYQRESR